MRYFLYYNLKEILILIVQHIESKSNKQFVYILNLTVLYIFPNIFEYPFSLKDSPFFHIFYLITIYVILCAVIIV